MAPTRTTRHDRSWSISTANSSPPSRATTSHRRLGRAERRARRKQMQDLPNTILELTGGRWASRLGAGRRARLALGQGLHVKMTLSFPGVNIKGIDMKTHTESTKGLADSVRGKLVDQVHRVRENLDDLENETVHQARRATRMTVHVIHAHPYKAIGI